MLANIIRNRKKTGIGGGGGGIVIDNGDPFYSAVSLLLPMDGTNGSTTFTDSGPNALAVTAVGNTQISTTQSKYGGASAYFDGSGDYLDMSGTGIATAFGTGDFTIELWYYPLSVSVQQNLVDKIGSASNAIYMSSAGVLKYYVGADRITGATLSANTWYHIALVRYSGTTKLYVNGVQSGASYTDTNNYALNTGSPRIGAAFNNTVSVNGYIDDFRISQFARYTSTFTPPTAALPTTASSTPADPYYGYNSILLHMDGSSGSTNFVDSGPNAIAVTAVGNAQVSTTQSKYGGASAYFDGTGDYLSIPTTSAFGFGTSDYTAECWIYITGGQGLDRQIIDFRPSPSVPGVLFISTSNKLTFWNGTTIGGTGTALTTGVWYHVALCRSSGTTRCFLNGTLEWSSSVAMDFTSSRPLGIGAYVPIGASVAVFNGYIDDLRVTKYARYTSAFTPPTQAHLEFANGNDRHFSNVSLLLHMDGANGSTTFTDNSANALAVTAVGNAQISTSSPQYGTGSATFDGATNTALSLDGSTGKYAFGTSPFTVEFWLYPTNLTARQGVYSNNLNSSSGIGTGPVFSIRGLGTTGVLGVGNVGASDTVQTGSNAISANVWQHVALVREGTGTNQSKIYVNGLLAATGTISDNFSTSRNAAIGRTIFYSEYFTGKIDDVRITKGVARYTSNFTPPTAEFPNA